jgi:hypothetical protein
MTISWERALGWRLRRHWLTPADGGSDADPSAADPSVAGPSVADVVSRLVAVPAWSGDPAFAVGIRRTDREPGELDQALATGRLVRVFTFRGATHLMTPDQAGVHLALRAAGRMWERPGWQSYYGLTPNDWPALREAVRAAVAGGPVTLDQLSRSVAGRGRFRHLRDALGEAGTFLKPFFWLGDLCYGPDADGRTTVQALDGVPGWSGLPELDDAGRRAITGYLAGYGPATDESLYYWLGSGLGAGRRRIAGWLQELADTVSRVDVGGQPAYLLTEHVDQLAARTAADRAALLTGYDQWMMGPGTADPHVVPPALRPAVTRGGNPVLIGSTIVGTWKVAKNVLTVSSQGDLRAPASGAGSLAAAADRVGALLGRRLDLVVE